MQKMRIVLEIPLINMRQRAHLLKSTMDNAFCCVTGLNPRVILVG